MNARPYPQKKDVDSIALNASLHPLEAPTKRSATKTSWMTFAMIMRLQKLHARIPQDSMIQLNTNRSLQSHVTSTGNRYQLSMQPFQITKHNLQRMNARPYPQKKDVDSIALNASLHPLEAPTKRSATKTSWTTPAMIMRLQKLLCVKASVCKSFCV